VKPAKEHDLKRIHVLFYAAAFATALIVGGTVPGLISYANGQQQPASTVKPLEDYIEIELSRVDEAYSLIERFGQRVWPGWTNYLEPEFYLNFPNSVRVLVGSPHHVPEGFEPIAGRTLHGRALYINRKDEMPIKLGSLTSTGGNGGPSVQIYFAQLPATPFIKPSDGGISETDILVDVHELFHCFQHQIKAYKAANDRVDAITKGSGPFLADLNYAKWSSVEGRALLGAYDAKDKKSVREYLEDYLVARREKQKGMPAFMIATEENEQVSEGTAEYANDKMAMLVRDAKYTGSNDHAGDQFYSKFAAMNAYIDRHLREQTTYSMDATTDTGMKYYQFGALICLALDRVSPKWKLNFFQSGKTLDDVVSGVLRLKPADEERIEARLATKYNMAEIEAKHRPVIEQRDQALAVMAGRKGRRFVVDFSKLPKRDVVALAWDYTKPMVKIGARFIFLKGMGPVKLAQVEVATADTPVDYLIPTRTVEWIDTELTAGDKGYELKAGSQDGDVLKDVTLTTKGFTLKAPEVQIVENKDKDEVRVLILSKVNR
jgi:hypothetical protein